MKKILAVLLCLCLLGCTPKESYPYKKSSNWDAFLSGRSVKEVLTREELNRLDLRKLFDDKYISFKNTEEFDFPLNSTAYLLVEISDRDALYGKNYEEEIYPASLTKLITLDTVLRNCESLDDTSSYTYEQYNELIKANASIAGLRCNYAYTLRDLLYALILPSGADAAVALENYFTEREKDLVTLMNERVKELGCEHTNITNTTGLHDDEHYLSLNDLLKTVQDIFLLEEGYKILNSFSYELSDGNTVYSTLSRLKGEERINIHGGKTGFTGQAGQNIFVYYSHEGRDYLLFLANALSESYAGKSLHFDDVTDIIYNIYSNE